jgi:hypothetical protein
MSRGPPKAPYPSFSLMDHLHVLFVSLCSSCLCVGPRSSPSPPASPRLSGELDALLEPLDDNDRADALSLHSQYGRGRGRRKPEKRRKEISIAGFSLFGRQQRDESPDDDTDEDEELRPAFAVDEDGDEREAHAITTSTLDQLPELAQKWEPKVTLQDLQQEEDRLAEMERQAERAGGLDIYSPPISKAGQTYCGTGGSEDDFGDFETAGGDYSAGDGIHSTSGDGTSLDGDQSTAADDIESLEATDAVARSEGHRAAIVDASNVYVCCECRYLLTSSKVTSAPLVIATPPSRATDPPLHPVSAVT